MSSHPRHHGQAAEDRLRAAGAGLSVATAFGAVRKVHKNTHMSFDGRLYSVPWTLVGTDVWLRATSCSVVVYADDERVTTHRRGGQRPRSTIEEHLPEHRRTWRHRTREYWEEAAETPWERRSRTLPFTTASTA